MLRIKKHFFKFLVFRVSVRAMEKLRLISPREVSKYAKLHGKLTLF